MGYTIVVNIQGKVEWTRSRFHKPCCTLFSFNYCSLQKKKKSSQDRWYRIHYCLITGTKCIIAIWNWKKKVLNLQVHFLQLNEFISTPYIIYYRRLNIYLECWVSLFTCHYIRCLILFRIYFYVDWKNQDGHYRCL